MGFRFTAKSITFQIVSVLTVSNFLLSINSYPDDMVETTENISSSKYCVIGL